MPWLSEFRRLAILGCTEVPIACPLACWPAAGEAAVVVDGVCCGASDVCDCCVCERCNVSGSVNMSLLALVFEGTIGGEPTVGEVNPSDPCEESLVRFFLRNPSDGITVSLLLSGSFRFRGTQGSE